MESNQIPHGPRSAQLLMLSVSLIGLAVVVLDLPRWAQIISLVVMLGLVGAGSALYRRQLKGWRPSETLAEPASHDR